MAEFYPFCRTTVALLLLTVFAVPGISQTTQTLTAKENVNIDQWCNGYYESLPAGYSSNPGKKYPLLISLAGEGEMGNGSDQLSYMLHNGPTLQISQGNFPKTISVNGNTYSFIVMAPQMISWPSTNQAVDDIINYAIAHYNVDQSRIYLTGLSEGGGITWFYAGGGAPYTNRLAGIVPVAGANYPSVYRSIQMVKYHLPVWATHNENDPTVTVWYTEEYINQLDSMHEDPTPWMTIFPVSGHDSWTETYNSLVQNGLTVYQWMLQYQRVGDNIVIAGTSAPLPVELTDYGLDVSGNTVDIHWTTAQEENNRYFILQRSGDGQTFSDLDTIPSAGSGGHSYSYTDGHPLAGNDFYRLEQVDVSGQTTFFSILKASFATSAAQTFTISPNPAVSTINLQISSPTQGALYVSIVDVQGRVLQTSQFEKQGQQWTQALNVSQLSKGTYFVKIEATGYRSIQAFIKE